MDPPDLGQDQSLARTAPAHTGHSGSPCSVSTLQIGTTRKRTWWASMNAVTTAVAGRAPA